MRSSAGEWLRRILVLSHWKQWDWIRSLATASEFKKAMAVSQRELGCGQATYKAVSPLMLSCWGGITGLEGLPNWIASLLLQLRSDNQCKGVSKRPWWMITRRNQQVPCGFNLFLTSDSNQSCQVTQIERHQLCQCKSSLNHKAIIFLRFHIVAPSFLPKLYEHSTLPLHSNTGGTLEVAAFFWIHKVCLI